MRQARVQVAVVVCLGLLASLAAVGRTDPVGAAGPPPKKPVRTIPDGSWQGVTTSAGGTASQGDALGFTNADVTFEFTVEDGSVVEGRMGVTGAADSFVPGGGANLAISGSFDLAGTAEQVTFEGVMNFEGSVTAQGVTVPVSGSGPGTGAFSPKTVTCSKITGDLAYEGRQVQQSAGVSTTVTAPFVALRVKGIDAYKVLAEFSNLAAEINALLEATVFEDDPVGMAEQLFALVQKAVTALNHVAKLKACGAVPKGFQEGFADASFADAFRQLVVALLARADQLTAAQVLTVLYVAYQMGVVGPSAPDVDAMVQVLSQFIDVLGAKIDEALADGDVQTLIDILAAAEQLGLDDLAAKADAAVDEFLESQKSGG